VSPGPLVGVGGVVLRGGTQVLLVQRGHPPGKGMWSLPGGKVRLGETLADALTREMLEETSLHVNVGALIDVVEIQREGFHYVVLDYLCTVDPPGQEPAAASDAEDVCWVEIARLAEVGATEALMRVASRAVKMTVEN